MNRAHTYMNIHTYIYMERGLYVWHTMNNGGRGSWERDAVAEAMTTIENIIRICDHKAKGDQEQRPATTNDVGEDK